MRSDYYIFDLDGTISDPKVGMARSINFSLQSHELIKVDDGEIAKLIGLPLDEMYMQLCGITELSLVTSLIASYRERYRDTGYAENTLYPEIQTSLDYLYTQPGLQLGVCTSKPPDMAKKILEMFGLDQIFDFISGGDVGIEKTHQLEQLLSDGIISRNSVMIGDRFVDIRAAQHNQLRSAAVLWGYGSRVELEKECPSYFLQHPSQLMESIL